MRVMKWRRAEVLRHELQVSTWTASVLVTEGPDMSLFILCVFSSSRLGLPSSEI